MLVDIIKVKFVYGLFAKLSWNVKGL